MPSVHSVSFKKTTAGFTLFELLVSMAIIFIITAIVVIRYNSFYSSVLLKSQAYEMALDIREAQVYSISIRAEGSIVREEYGVYFDTSSPNRYQLFLDSGSAEPALYNSGEEIDNPFLIDSRFRISRICVNSCTSSAHDISDLSVSFQRPNFDAILGYGSGSVANSARIEIQSVVDESAVMAVVISSTGQITVEADQP